MPTIIVTDEVTDTDRCLSSPKREELLPSLGAHHHPEFLKLRRRLWKWQAA
jgi:hypothetical protein